MDKPVDQDGFLLSADIMGLQLQNNYGAAEHSTPPPSICLQTISLHPGLDYKASINKMIFGFFHRVIDHIGHIQLFGASKDIRHLGFSNLLFRSAYNAVCPGRWI